MAAEEEKNSPTKSPTKSPKSHKRTPSHIPETINEPNTGTPNKEAVIDISSPSCDSGIY